jgi:hypothetical protein
MNLPNEPGVYWARCPFERRRLLVHVYGTAPFLQWKAWDLLTHSVYSGVSVGVPSSYEFLERIPNCSDSDCSDSGFSEVKSSE